MTLQLTGAPNVSGLGTPTSGNLQNCTAPLQPWTGAVSRTLQAKEGDIVSVKDFGATGNGSTDDTAAIVAAFSAAGTLSAALLFPEGIYLVSNTVTVPTGVPVYGHGFQTTIIRRGTWVGTAGAPLFQKAVGSTYYAYHDFRDLTFDGQGTNAGMLLYESYHNVFRNCNFTNCLSYGLKLSEAGDTLLSFCEFSNINASTDIGLLIDGGSGAHADHCNFLTVAGIGVSSTQLGPASGSSGCWINNSLFAGLGGTGIVILNGQQSWTVDTCYFEGYPGASMVPFTVGAVGTGAGTNVVVNNCLIANANNVAPVITSAGVLTWTNNVSGQPVNFTSGVGYLHHTGNSYVVGTATLTIGCSKYFDNTPIVAGASVSGDTRVGNQSLLVGTTSAFGTLTVDTSKGSAGANNQVVIGNIATPANATGLYMRATSADAVISTAGAAIAFGTNSGTNWMRLVSDRLQAGADNTQHLGDSSHRWIDVYAVNNVIQTSDENQKTDIKDSDLGLSFIKQLRPVSYKWKVAEKIKTGEVQVGEEEVEGVTTRPVMKDVYSDRPGVRSHYGLLAQQVKAVLGDTDFAGFVHDKDLDQMGLRYSQFIAPLVKAVQELAADFEAYKASHP